jgi:hypothetical protein
MGSLGRAITLYGGIERVAIRPAHLRDGGFEHIFQLSDGRDTLMHSRSVPQGASAPQRWTKARARGLRFDCRDQGSCANDIYDAREIVGEHTERHFGDDLRQRFRQKVGRAHARFHRAERVLERLAANAHRLRILVEAALCSFEPADEISHRRGRHVEFVCRRNIAEVASRASKARSAFK